ncbi:hypothetical protein V8E36_007608 [Tilletia maclaganii]
MSSSEADPDYVGKDAAGLVQLLASTVHPQVRDILRDDELQGAQLGEAMIRAIDVQLRLHDEQDASYRGLIDQRDDDILLPVSRPSQGDDDHGATLAHGTSGQPATLFAQAAARVAIELGQAKDAEAKAIAKRVPLVASPAFRQAVFRFARLPYAVMTQALAFASTVASQQHVDPEKASASDDATASDVDESIIRNEKYMRARTILDPQPGAQRERHTKAPEGENSPSLAQLGIDKSSSHWQQFMVGLGRDINKVFPAPGPSDAEGTRTLTRASKDELPGLLLLDHHRPASIAINDLKHFQARFDSMTGSILQGLDWSNVLVAGGIALAALTSTTDAEAAKSEGSDIDLYLYDLTFEQANAKLQEIEEVFANNLPIDKDSGKKLSYGVLRNSLTITFIPERYPHRRVQVVLKLCSNPMSILLNFDLDQVALGYTGAEVWMLPRTARALITGYTTFTMDLIHGSFLSPRKATQDQRLFKYAERGYGIRFLPSFVQTLPKVPLTTKTTSRTDVDEASLPRDELHVCLREERERVAWWLSERCEGFHLPLGEHEIRMVDIDCRTNNSGELAERSSLSVWQLFARHVALWEYAQQGYCTLDRGEMSWVEACYADDPLSYQDGPDFDWNSDFTLEKLRTIVQEAHSSDEDKLVESLAAFNINTEGRANCRQGRTGQTDKWLHEPIALQRTLLASSLQEAFAQPLVAVVHLPKNIRALAESKLSDAMSRMRNVTKPGAPSHRSLADWEDPATLPMVTSDSDFELLYWIQGPGEPRLLGREPAAATGRIAPHWQLIERQKDELLEVIHAFRRGHRDLCVEPFIRNRSTRRQASRRLVRPTERSERDAFARWVCNRVPEFTGWYGETEGWAMLKASRDLVFKRFELTQQEAADFADDIQWFDFDDPMVAPPESIQSSTLDPSKKAGNVPEPQTVADWREYLEARSLWPDWMAWYRQRIPSATLLPALREEKEAAKTWGRVYGTGTPEPDDDDDFDTEEDTMDEDEDEDDLGDD